MEGLSQLKHLIQEGDWMCKLDLKNAYSSVPLDRNWRKFVRFQWKRTLQVHLTVFWNRPSTKSVYKVIKNSNLSHEKNKHQGDNIFGRYIDFESRNTRSSHESRHSHISPAEFGLYNKYKEINFAPMSENRISGNGDRFNQNDFVIDTREGTKSCQDLA